MSKNWAVSAVATAPSPAASGTSLVVTAGHGVRFARGFATVNPVTTEPTPLNAELIFIDSVATDTLTIVRAQESSTARTIVVGDEIRMGLPAGQWDSLGGMAYNVKGYGAKCDDTANDAAAIQAAINACSAAGGGTVLVPGKCFVGTTTITLPSQVILAGTGRVASHIRKAAGTSIMIDHSGTATGAANHVKASGIRDITLRGTSGGCFGAILRTYYCNNFRMSNVHFFVNDDKMWDVVETQDSYVTGCTFESGGGSNIAAPMVHIRNASAAAGFGSSTDVSNMIWFDQCRWEDYEDGAVWIEQPAAFSSAPPNGMFFQQVKFETHRVRGIPVIFDGGCSNVHVQQADVVMGAFAPGVTTAVAAMQVAAFEHASVQSVRFVGQEASSMAYGVEIYCQDGPTVIDGVGHIGLAPTVALVAQNGGTGEVRVTALASNTGGVTLLGGTLSNGVTVQQQGPIPLAAVATPTAPAAGQVKLFGRSVAGRILPAIMGPSGLDTSLQPLLGRNRVCWVAPVAGTTTVSGTGVTLTATGTATLATPASTNLHTSLGRIDYLVTTAATTAVAGFRSSVAQFWRGNAAGLGGFFYICRWSPATGQATTTSRAFCGLAAATGAPTDVEPSSLVSMLGMGWDAADAQMQMMGNDATGTATKTALGASFAVPTTDRPGVYELAMFAPPNGSNVQWLVTNVGTGATASGTISAAADLPANTTFLAPRGYCSVGGTSSVIGLTLFGLYVETDT